MLADIEHPLPSPFSKISGSIPVDTFLIIKPDSKTQICLAVHDGNHEHEFCGRTHNETNYE